MPKKLSKKQITFFQRKVYEVVKKIPLGKVLTYREVAKRIGYPKAYRAVGNALNKSASWRTKIPCHRIIKSDGKIGGYSRGIKKKIVLLKEEGITINSYGKITSRFNK